MRLFEPSFSGLFHRQFEQNYNTFCYVEKLGPLLSVLIHLFKYFYKNKSL